MRTLRLVLVILGIVTISIQTLFPAAAARAQVVQSSSGPEPLFLRQAVDEACVEGTPGAPRCFNLPGPGRVTALEATRAGWIAAGLALVEGRWRVFARQSWGAEPTVLLPPGGLQARRVNPVPLLHEGELAGLAWLEGPRQEEQAVWVARWDGTAWSEPDRVAPPATQVALTGTVLSDGSWLLLWTQNDGQDDETVYSLAGPAGWSAARSLLGDNTVFDVAPALISLGDGALAAWSRFDGSDYRLVLARLDAGVWRELQELPGLGGGRAGFVRIGGRLWLLYRTAVPDVWNLVELDERSLPIDHREVAGPLTSRPVVRLEDGRGVLSWPDGGAEPIGAGVTEQPPPAATEGTVFRYLAFGDSITNGVGCNSGGGYPGRLPAAGYLDCAANTCEVVNKGKPGEATIGGITRLKEVLDNEGPWDVLILMEGTNDICWTSNTSNAAIQSHLNTMERDAALRGVDTLHSTIIDLRSSGYQSHPCPEKVGLEDDEPGSQNQMGNRVRNNLANVDRETEHRWWANTRSNRLSPPEVDLALPLCNNSDSCFANNYADWGHPNCSGYDRLTDEIRDGIVARPVPGPPGIVSPTGTIATSSPILTWDKEASGDATWQHLVLDGRCGNILDEWMEDPIDAQVNYLAPQLPNGDYTWRVQGRNPHGRSAWDQGTFTVETEGAAVCVPAAAGVPYLRGSPNWWNDSLTPPEYWPATDDPRWQGSFLFKPVHPSSVTPHVTFRALRNANEVFMAWVVTVDPLLDSGEKLYVGLSPSGGGADDMLLEITPFDTRNTSTGVPLPRPADVKVQSRGGEPCNPFTPSSVPAWLNTSTTDVRVVRSVGDSSWAVLMKIPLLAPPAGVDLGTSFKMWFEVMVTHPTGVVRYAYPPTLGLSAVENGTDTTAWMPARRDLAPTAPECIQGVTLASSDIGTVDTAGDCVPAVTLSSGMKVDDGAGGPGTIVFCARPQNDGPPLAPYDINATFRLANWGSTSRLTGTWDQVNTPDCDSTTGTPDPERACNLSSIETGTKGAITYEWSLTEAQACSFDVQPHPVDCSGQPVPTKDDHQCILVEMNGMPGVTFPISSVARNMNFVQASTFSREAEISVQGLPPKPTPTPQRDVYLYVQTKNMPRVAKPGMGRTRTQSIAAANTAATAARDPSGAVEPPRDAPPLEGSSYEELRETEPTYEVHAFHDTGRTITLSGQSYKVLEPQTSFGYFVDHAEQLRGWRHELTGAQEMIPGKYYRIAVPEGGSAKVITTIKAIEHRWSWSIHGGVNDPQSDLARLVSGGASVGLDLEYAFNETFALELFLGHDQFSGKNGFPDIDVTHLSLNGKAYVVPGPNRIYVNAGLGTYDFSPGSSETGFNLGLGAQRNLWPQATLEVGAKNHFVSSRAADLDFITLQVGARVRF